MRVISSPSNITLDPIVQNTHIGRLRGLIDRMNEKLEAAEKKGLGEEAIIDAKASILTISTAMLYLIELFGKTELLEKRIINQQIINLNLLQSNKQKDIVIKNQEEKINELLERL
jgi:hypothetical protein